MKKIKTLKPKLVIAGPGAGKTHNMVDAIILAVNKLDPSRYAVVITYTNSATNNIKRRLSKKITLPENLFIGTMHSFLNRFIVIPYSSLVIDQVGVEKLFLQCDTEAVLETVKKVKKKTYSFKEAAVLKARIKESLNKKGYITYDQTVSLAQKCIEITRVRKIISNRIQFLFVDEFQDTSNAINNILENIRKQDRTEIYCVGDPEQYIQSFDSSLKTFSNIPILKTSANKAYLLEINNLNHRCSIPIITFLNNFNRRQFGEIHFHQSLEKSFPGTSVKFINKARNVKDILPVYNSFCDIEKIKFGERYIIAKRNDVIKRIAAALNNQFLSPQKNQRDSLLGAMKDSLLSTLQLNQTQFFEKYSCDVYMLRKFCLSIIKAIRNGTITNEDSYGIFVTEVLKLELKEGLPIKVENFKEAFLESDKVEYLTISNIHTIKGLEADGVLAIAKTEKELLLWMETDHTVRDDYRDNETTDYPRLGYVAFSRAKKLLCIACLENVSKETLEILKSFDVQIE